jgi:hypothetical protein
MFHLNFFEPANRRQKSGYAAPLQHNKTGFRTLRFAEKTKKDALRLVQSDINPFIISTFSQNSRRKNVQSEGKIDLFRHKIGLFRTFSGSRRPPKST